MRGPSRRASGGVVRAALGGASPVHAGTRGSLCADEVRVAVTLGPVSPASSVGGRPSDDCRRRSGKLFVGGRRHRRLGICRGKGRSSGGRAPVPHFLALQSPKFDGPSRGVLRTTRASTTNAVRRSRCREAMPEDLRTDVPARCSGSDRTSSDYEDQGDTFAVGTPREPTVSGLTVNEACGAPPSWPFIRDAVFHAAAAMK